MSTQDEQTDPTPRGNPGPIIHQRADSDSCLEELFAFGLKPPGAQPTNQKPLRMRNLPESFFTPPQSGGSRSPSCHTRENSFDGSMSNQLNFSPAQPGGQPPQGMPVHTRAHSSPANLQQTMAAVQQQQQQHFHLRQPSCDVSQGVPDLGPLPPGWEAARTPQGMLYFMNHITKTTQWEDPRIQIQQQQLKETSEDQGMMTRQQLLNQPLPHGWEQAVTPEGETYFINHITKTTSWFDPRLPASNQSLPIRVGQMHAQQQQQMLRLQRLENERRVLQQRQAEIEKMQQQHNRFIRQQQQTSDGGFHDNIQAAQDMLMRQNLNGDAFHPRPTSMQHIREESADSGLDMGTTLGSIPEEMSGMESMDTDLDTTLTNSNSQTVTRNLNGCNIPQQVATSDQFSGDIMQNILASQNQQPQMNQTEETLTWL